MSEKAIELLRKSNVFGKIIGCKQCQRDINRAIAELEQPEPTKEELKQYAGGLENAQAFLDERIDRLTARIKELEKPEPTEFTQKMRKKYAGRVYADGSSQTLLDDFRKAWRIIDRLTAELKDVHKEYQDLASINLKIEAEVERLKELFERIHTWTKAYPLDVFLKPDLKKAHKVLKAAGMSLDAISADAMRHVLDGIREIVEQALKEQ